MLKIESRAAGNGELTLRLAGEITGPWVDELRRVTRGALDSGAALTVDLADVLFVDLDGVALLGRLAARSVALVNASAFVTELLRVRA